MTAIIPYSVFLKLFIPHLTGGDCCYTNNVTFKRSTLLKWPRDIVFPSCPLIVAGKNTHHPPRGKVVVKKRV